MICGSWLASDAGARVGPVDAIARQARSYRGRGGSRVICGSWLASDAGDRVSPVDAIASKLAPTGGGMEAG